jgi:hypothetical protein
MRGAGRSRAGTITTLPNLGRIYTGRSKYPLNQAGKRRLAATAWTGVCGWGASIAAHVHQDIHMRCAQECGKRRRAAVASQEALES